MQCICGAYIEMFMYGFHKCEKCGRIYALGENGMVYTGQREEV